MSFTVSVVAQNKGTDSVYPIGIERWKPTSWSPSSFYFGIRNDTKGMSERWNHMRV